MKKKQYFLKSLALAALFCSGTLSAQLSGVITIDNTQPVSVSNYTSFTQLAQVLNTSGVSGPLTVNVFSGSSVYNEQVQFLQAPGISATNTITINGNGATISFNATVTTLRHTLLLTGADYMTFNNLIVTGTNSTSALSCHLWAGADNNRFNNCVFNAPLVGTATAMSPFSISGTSVSATAAGLSGSSNVVNTCTTNGGYYGVTFYSSSSAPFDTDNQIINSTVLDFYSTGIYNVYAKNSIIRGNIVERPTRTAVTASEGIYLGTGSLNSLVERNHVRRSFNGVSSSTSTFYGIYNTADGTLGNENVIRNNVISDIIHNGTLYGIYLNGSPYSLVYHNTISLDHSTATAGNTRGISILGTAPNCQIRNNIVTVTRGGSGVKYCLYYSAASVPGMISENNVLFMNAVGGTTNTCWLTSDYATLASWQSATGNDLLSNTADPVYTNSLALDYVPTSTAVNNLGSPIGVLSDFNLTARSLTFPDPGAYEIFNTPCVGAPGANSFVSTQGVFCPGKTEVFNLLNSGTYTNTGYEIQWYNSTFSNVGPFTAISGATLNSYVTPPINVTSYYTAVISCTSGGSYTTAAQGVTVAPATTSLVPYYESFETFALNQLPNCSWTGSDMGGATQTYTNSAGNNRVPRTGSNFAAFANSPSGTNYFYSNGIQMNAGITYSAALWFITETGATNNWPDLSILVGPNQTPTGLLPVASTNGTLTPQLYTLLSNTFVVPTSGIYYVAVRATSGSGTAPYISWDDLSITIPCDINGPSLGLTASNVSVCVGSSLTLTGTGANSYSWSTGQTSPAIVINPVFPTTYTLTGTDVLSGCQTVLTQFIDVKPSPLVAALASNTLICPGAEVNLNASGATSYFWSNGVIGANAVVSPTVTTTYSVIGTNTIGCSSTAVLQIDVTPAPVITAVSSLTVLCSGDELILTADGANIYSWMLSPTEVLLGNPVIVHPEESATYTVTGTGANGCEGKTTISFAVEECTGISEAGLSANSLKVYPNPGNGIFILESHSVSGTIEVSDISGRIVYSQNIDSAKSTINITGFAAGVYYLKVSSAAGSQVVKLIKNTN